MTLEQEQIALQYGPVVVLSAAHELQSARGRAKDESGRVAGVRELEQLGAALRLASELNAEDRQDLLTRWRRTRPWPCSSDSERHTPASLRAVLTVLFAARRAVDMLVAARRAAT